MIVIGTSGVKCCMAMRAMIATRKVFGYGHFVFAGAAKNSLCVEFFLRPSRSGMTGFFRVTMIARIIGIAAFEFNSNNVNRRMIMYTAGLIIHYFSFDNRVHAVQS